MANFTNAPIDDAALDALFREAHTANSFTDEPVTGEQLRTIVELAQLGPTAMNAQPARLVVVRSPEAKARLLPHLAEGNRAKTEAAPATILAAAYTDFHEEMPRIWPAMPDIRDTFEANEEGRKEMAGLNTGLQIGYLIMAIRAAGLAAGPMSGMDAAGVTEEFFSGGRHRALVAINIGKPGENAFHDRMPRLSFDEVAEVL